MPNKIHNQRWHLKANISERGEDWEPRVIEIQSNWQAGDTHYNRPHEIKENIDLKLGKKMFFFISVFSAYRIYNDGHFDVL